MMQIIDSHVHIWTHSPEFPWSACEQDIPSFDAHPQDILELMSGNGVEWTVLVQYIKYRWDNRYVARALKEYPSLFVGVCRVDPEDPNSPDHLSYWTEEHGFQGVRLGPTSGTQDDWFSERLMVPLFKRAAALKVPIFILTQQDRLVDLARIVGHVPEAIVVIDHLADCINQTEIHLDRLLALAKFPGVFLKIGHIPNFSTEAYPWADTHRSLERIIRHFGVERILWGSDWPFCLNQMTYRQSLDFIQKGVGFLSQKEKEWILGKTASKIWPQKQNIQSEEAL